MRELEQLYQLALRYLDGVDVVKVDARSIELLEQVAALHNAISRRNLILTSSSVKVFKALPKI